jgi:Pol polyprotein, beta-barrel domain
VRINGDRKQDSPKGSGSANAAVESDDEAKAAFFVDLNDENKLPMLLSNYESDSDDEEHANDWFSELGDEAEYDTDADSQDNVDESDCNPLVNICDDAAVTEPENADAVQIGDSTEPESTNHIEVYDSGCTRHITPYREAVMDFAKIRPKSFQAANHQSFNAVRMGEMVIDIPNGVTTSKLKLTEVLYLPEPGLVTPLYQSDDLTKLVSQLLSQMANVLSKSEMGG